MVTEDLLYYACYLCLDRRVDSTHASQADGFRIGSHVDKHTDTHARTCTHTRMHMHTRTQVKVERVRLMDDQLRWKQQRIESMRFVEFRDPCRYRVKTSSQVFSLHIVFCCCQAA